MTLDRTLLVHDCKALSSPQAHHLSILLSLNEGAHNLRSVSLDLDASIWFQLLKILLSWPDQGLKVKITWVAAA